MPESIQHRLGRVRPPRVHITYDVEIGGASESRELPFVIGVLADLLGHSEPTRPLRERSFIQIDRVNFNDVLAGLRPQLRLSIADQLSGGAAPLSLELSFSHLDDFAPVQVVRQVPALTLLLGARQRLIDLLAKVDGNDRVAAQIERFVKDRPALEQARGTALEQASLESAESRQWSASSEPSNEEPLPQPLDEIVERAGLVRDKTQLPYGRALLVELAGQVLDAHIAADSDLLASLATRITQLDQMLSTQLNEVLHAEAFQRLEASWRGLHFLVNNVESSPDLKLRVLPISRRELGNDLERTMEFDQSTLFKQIYEHEFGTYGGAPYSLLLCDFEFGRRPQDLAVLEKLSHIAAAAHAPIVTAASPQLFDLPSFTALGNPRELGKIFESSELARWRSFRDSDDSRYVTLVLPRVLMRLPYGPDMQPVDEFLFEEDVDGKDHAKYLWGNAAYALAQRIADAFAKYRWTAAIRGVEGGGLVQGLPTHEFLTEHGDRAVKCPTEVAITDRRERELADLGFVPLCYCKGSDYAAFFSVQTVNRPRTYDTAEANANARLSCQLPYMLATCRFAHYLKAMMRDKVGSFSSREQIEVFLNRWISQYVLLQDDAGQEMTARYPLREARVDVSEVPGRPGSYRAVIFLRPHFQLNELTTSLRLVAELPPPV